MIISLIRVIDNVFLMKRLLTSIKVSMSDAHLSLFVNKIHIVGLHYHNLTTTSIMFWFLLNFMVCISLRAYNYKLA